MAVTTNNEVRLTLMFEDLSEQTYTFDGVPDEQIAGVRTRAEAANSSITSASSNIREAFKSTAINPSTGSPYYPSKFSKIKITSTEEEVIYGG